MLKWVINLLVEPYSLPEMPSWYIEKALSADVGSSPEIYGWELYAVLTAAGFPRLAFLLTDVVDPRDEVDEAIARWKNCVSYATVEVRGRKVFDHVIFGFLVHVSYLCPPSRDDLRLLREQARRGEAEAVARLEVEREIRRLIEMAEGGFEGPEMEGFFDRYIDALASVEGSFEDALFEKRDGVSGEELAEWAALGAGKLDRTPDGELVLSVKAKSSRELPRELRGALRRRWELQLLKALREVAALLAVARYARVNGFILATWS